MLHNNSLSETSNDSSRSDLGESSAMDSPEEMQGTASGGTRHHSSSTLPVILSSKSKTMGRRKSLSSLPVERTSSLQSSNRRRKYLRRGSKTPKMLRIPLSMSAKMLKQLDRNHRDECSWGTESSELSLSTIATSTSSSCGGSGFLPLNSSCQARVEAGSSVADVASISENDIGAVNDSPRRSRSFDLVTMALREASECERNASSTKSKDGLCTMEQIQPDTFNDFSNTILKTRLTLSVSAPSVTPGTPMPSPLSSSQQQVFPPPPPVPWATPSPPLQRPASQGGPPLPSPNVSRRSSTRQNRGGPQSPTTVELLTSALKLSSLHETRDCPMRNN